MAEALITIASRHQAHFDRYKAGEAAKFDKFLRQMDKDIRDRLTRFELTEITRKKLEQQIAIIGELLSGTLDEYHEVWRESVKEAAVYEAGFETRALGEVVQGVSFTLPSDAQIAAAVFAAPLAGIKGPDGGSLLEPFYQNFKATEIRRIEGAIRAGYAQGQTTSQVVQAIRGTKAAGYSDGILAITSRDARSMAHTALQHASQQARDAVWQANSSVIKKWRFVATLDGKTSTSCFVSSTSVSWIGRLEKVFRAEYVGEIVIITTSRGKKLEGTPNHPILTPDGFLPLGELKPGQEVVASMLGESSGVCCHKEVGVPSEIGKLFDFVEHESISDVARISSSANDFYGDGAGVDGEINAVSVDSKLSYNIMTGSLKIGENNSLGLNGRLFSLSGLRYIANGLFSWPPSIKPPKDALGLFKLSVYPMLAASKFLHYFRRSFAGLVHFNRFLSVGDNSGITNASLERLHDPMPLKEGCDCGCGSSKLSSEACGALPLSVHPDYVVSVKREFRRCHVYTLQCDTGFYNAGGIIVKNCRSLDGTEYPLGKGPKPPLHINCRSSTSAVLVDKYAYLSEGRTRASRDPETGKIKYVKANQSYYDWLKEQPLAFQESVIGKDRAQLLNNGGLSAERFAELNLNKNFTPATLEEMRRMEPTAFERAGI